MNTQAESRQLGEGHILTWQVDGDAFELQVIGDAATLWLPDGQVIDMSNHEWTVLAKAIKMAIGAAEAVGAVVEPVARKGSTKPKGTRTGIRWTQDDDAKLLNLWGSGATVRDPMARFDRNEGGITSRLVKLRAAAARDDVLAESKRREHSEKPICVTAPPAVNAIVASPSPKCLMGFGELGFGTSGLIVSSDPRANRL